jgi:hypothetical protein
MRAGKLERQREHIRELIDADPQRSNRSIAAEVGCSPHTVIRQRKRHVQALDENGTAATAHPGRENLIEPAGPGNDRAVSHGAYSSARRAPLEQEHRERLRSRYPDAPDDLINTASKRCAMIDLLAAWCADAGVVHPHRGQPVVSDPMRELRKLCDAHDAAIRALEAGAGATPPADRLAAHLAAHYGAGDGSDNASETS